MEPRLRLRRFRLERDSSSGPLDVDVEVHFSLLIFPSKFSGPRLFCRISVLDCLQSNLCFNLLLPIGFFYFTGLKSSEGMSDWTLIIFLFHDIPVELLCPRHDSQGGGGHNYFTLVSVRTL